MKIIQIIYKLNTDKDYTDLYKYLNSFNHTRVLNNVWWIKTDIEIKDIFKSIKQYVEDIDTFYITVLDINNIDRWINTFHWKWLKE